MRKSLEEMTLNDILKLNKANKLKAIEILIEEIANDKLFDAITHFETDEEFSRYKAYAIDKEIKIND